MKEIQDMPYRFLSFLCSESLFQHGVTATLTPTNYIRTRLALTVTFWKNLNEIVFLLSIPIYTPKVVVILFLVFF